ncbi:septum site-determining protein MinC [Alteromonas sp. MTD1]|uniref:septum site-determining protein MinC n=1 Tax=Alteromonas sp. MTD1 TaxID=3057962 RepID=UPI0036F3CE41
MTETCFRMKGTTLTSIVLEVIEFELDEFEAQLTQKVASAPQFFTRSSLILHLLKPLSATEFELLVALCKRLNLQPMAVKGQVAELKPVINDLGLADVSQSKFTDSVLKSQRSETNSEEGAGINSSQKEQNSAVKAENANNSTVQSLPTAQTPSVLKPAKVVSRPVRSGQQIYAQGSDLVVTASVSEGAELLADGNIHVYGTLRGRALAGVKGNSNARVFCQSLDAELVSIAGQFIMHESVKGDCWKKPAQIFLEEETLRIAPLS